MKYVVYKWGCVLASLFGLYHNKPKQLEIHKSKPTYFIDKAWFDYVHLRYLLSQSEKNKRKH